MSKEQKSPGGLLVGETDKNGGKGIKVVAPEGNILMGGGETIIVSDAGKANDKYEFEGEKKTPCEILSDINSKYGGVTIPCRIAEPANTTDSKMEVGDVIKKEKGGKIKKTYLKTMTVEEAKDHGLMGIENDHLTAEGMIAKMEEWDEAEHGVEPYIYDLTKADLKKLGAEMPKHIRRMVYEKGGEISDLKKESIRLEDEWRRLLKKYNGPNDQTEVAHKKRLNFNKKHFPIVISHEFWTDYHTKKEHNWGELDWTQISGWTDNKPFFKVVEGRYTPNEIGKQIGIRHSHGGGSAFQDFDYTDENVQIAKKALEDHGYKVIIKSDRKAFGGITEADESATSKYRAIENFKDQIRKDESVGIIDMYEQAAWNSGASVMEIEQARKDAKADKFKRFGFEKGGEISSSDLPKDGSEIKIHMPQAGMFPSKDIILKYDKSNFVFIIYDNGKRIGSITEKEVLNNINQGLYIIKSSGSLMEKGGKTSTKKLPDNIYWALDKVSNSELTDTDFPTFRQPDGSFFIEGIDNDFVIEKSDIGVNEKLIWNYLDRNSIQYVTNEGEVGIGKEDEKFPNRYLIYVVPQSSSFKPHVWVEGGLFVNKDDAEFQAKQTKKMKDIYKEVKVVSITDKEAFPFNQIYNEIYRNKESLNRKLMDAYELMASMATKYFKGLDPRYGKHRVSDDNDYYTDIMQTLFDVAGIKIDYSSGGKTQLQMGIEVEKEHRDLYLRVKKMFEANGMRMPIHEIEFYKTIAKAHLREDKYYYDKLLKYVEGKKMAIGSRVGQIDWKRFTLADLNKYLSNYSDVHISGIVSGRSEKIPQKIKENDSRIFTIGEFGRELTLRSGGENIVMDLIVYDEKNIENTISLYSKENKNGLKKIQNDIVEKFSAGGSMAVGRKTKDQYIKYADSFDGESGYSGRLLGTSAKNGDKATGEFRVEDNAIYFTYKDSEGKSYNSQEEPAHRIIMTGIESSSERPRAENGGSIPKLNTWQVYFMDNNRQKKILGKNLFYHQAVKMSQEKTSKGLSTDYEPIPK